MDNKIPYDFYKEARYFKIAAETLYENKPDDISYSSTYYLIGHSIELALKSYLLTKGYSVKTLKNVYGHDLEKLLRTSLEYKKFYSELNINKKDIESIKEIIELMNYPYKGKQLEYPTPGLNILPDKSTLFELLENILKGCKILCENLIEKNYKKGKFEG